ncbi:MAG: DEAD/DEAH box helicase family protein [Planctomycetes bacterium]|nr:DEAD/DEAH box helicase family protein [Planctomycetota bacterium]
MERLLAQPVIARIEGEASDRRHGTGTPTSVDAVMDLFADRYASLESRSSGPWQENATDGTTTVRVQIDYDGRWSGDQGARAVLDAVKGALEGPIACLTESQLALLQRAPREFLASTNRETIDLVDYDHDRVGRYPRVTALRLARLPTAAGAYTYLAIVPNLVQLLRQLAALDVLEMQGHEELDPLRVLVGATPSDRLAEVEAVPRADAHSTSSERLDEHQRDCAAKALASPHFTVIEGPPGSGKTTVISYIVRRALSQGWRMLIASSTHVAVDNIIEKLASAQEDDDLAPSSTPVRFASRMKSVAPAASGYWVGSKQEHRAPTIARRLEAILSAKMPGAGQLFQGIDPRASGLSPITAAIAAEKPVICGTPIGILSCEEVSQAPPGSFDLLVVDEVSKMTVPEFLAVAVKARRWCLVGDPSQMPPFCDPVEVAATFTEILSDEVELVCSVGAAVERTKLGERSALDLLVVAEEPRGVARAIDDHARQVQLQGIPPVQVYRGMPAARGILVCAPEDVPAILGASTTETAPRYRKVLVQHGLAFPNGVGESEVKERERASAVSIDTTYHTYHALPWARTRKHKLPLLGLRNGLDKYLPSLAALEALGTPPQRGSHLADLAESELAMAQRFAIHCTSVYDWLTGIPTQWFSDIPLLRHLTSVVPDRLAPSVQPFVGRLARQYRMHPSLSAVPRDLFYFNESLRDGIPDDTACRVRFLQVVGEASDNGEASTSEVNAIADLMPSLLAAMPAEGSIMVITPYRAQERALRYGLAAMDKRVEICTLDRCQGREADYVFISLVRDRATPFLDMPKRWNVALTRARKGLFFVGNIDNYLREAHKARASVRPGEPTKSSLLALVLESYDRLLEARRPR